MQRIALARVRLAAATAQNICGRSAQVYAIPGGARAEDQLVGWVDHITLLDNCVLFERDGHQDELVGLSSVAVMRPTDDLKKVLLGAEEAAQRVAEAKTKEDQRLAQEEALEARRRLREESRKRPAAPPVAALRDDDGDVLRPEAAITFKSEPVTVAVEDEAPKKSRKGKR